MAEVFVWPEGSAYLWTGNSSTSALVTFATRATVSPSIERYSYRAPYATTYTHIELDRRMRLSISQAWSPDSKTLANFLQNAAGGAAHCHVFALTPGVSGSGGWFGWTGVLEAGDLSTEDGGVHPFNINGWFEAWSAY